MAVGRLRRECCWAVCWRVLGQDDESTKRAQIKLLPRDRGRVRVLKRCLELYTVLVGLAGTNDACKPLFRVSSCHHAAANPVLPPNPLRRDYAPHPAQARCRLPCPSWARRQCRACPDSIGQAGTAKCSSRARRAPGAKMSPRSPAAPLGRLASE